ncbi:hypothetical protein [Azospirillum griseum]|uniref:Uncharacterized protein n=1 Tax=Azospirillum griseum TaxID=2496639 RepID=A0A431VAS5_9PROT|nr:hypothetical protein [Azospirillum griseum]RTR14636.1 hypothetical protein EJ903_23505 [Azospirillum griseum]
MAENQNNGRPHFKPSDEAGLSGVRASVSRINHAQEGSDANRKAGVTLGKHPEMSGSTLGSEPRTNLSSTWPHISLVGAFISGLLVYPLLFFTHKYSIPWSGMSDFSSYHEMVLKPLQFDAVRAPFAMRQMTTLIARFILEIGITFDKDIWFNYHSIMGNITFSANVFFALLVANTIGVWLTGMIVYTVAATADSNKILPVSIWGIAALGLLLLSGGTLFYVVSPLTEGWTWFLAALIWALRRRDDFWAWSTFPLLLLCIFQREMLPLAFLIMSMTERVCLRRVLSQNRKRFLHAFIAACVASLALYVALRGWIFPTLPTDTHQISPLGWFNRFIDQLPTLWDPLMIRSAFFKLNLPLLWASYVVWAMRHRLLGLDQVCASVGLGLAMASFFCIAYANGAGRAVDRYVVMLSPLFVLAIIDLTEKIHESRRV